MSGYELQGTRKRDGRGTVKRDGREEQEKRNRKGTEIPKGTTPKCKRDTNCGENARGDEEEGTEERDGIQQIRWRILKGIST